MILILIYELFSIDDITSFFNEKIETTRCKIIFSLQNLKPWLLQA